MAILAMDLGGSHIAGGVVSEGRVLASFNAPTDASSLRSLLQFVEKQLRECCRRAAVDVRDCAGIGIGMPSLIDSRSNEILCAFNKFPDITGSDLDQWSRETFGLPAKLENDASLALLGEHAAGNARNAQDVVLVLLGTGIGTGTMLGGRLLRSRLGHAGALGGHLTVRYNGRRCACGAIGCAEAEASTSVLPALAMEWQGFSKSLLAQEAKLDFEALFRASDRGDAVAIALLEHCLQVWSALAVTLVHAYGPELLLFGGGVLRRDQQILPAIRQLVEKSIWKTSRGLPRIEVAALGANVALIGAEELFREG